MDTFGALSSPNTVIGLRSNSIHAKVPFHQVIGRNQPNNGTTNSGMVRNDHDPGVTNTDNIQANAADVQSLTADGVAHVTAQHRERDHSRRGGDAGVQIRNHIQNHVKLPRIQIIHSALMR